MRQLWSTGWLHNRIRVVCASFLVKNLLLPWQWGLKHYWDALLDADLESAALGWQYVSGCMAGMHSPSTRASVVPPFQRLTFVLANREELCCDIVSDVLSARVHAPSSTLIMIVSHFDTFVSEALCCQYTDFRRNPLMWGLLQMHIPSRTCCTIRSSPKGLTRMGITSGGGCLCWLACQSNIYTGMHTQAALFCSVAFHMGMHRVCPCPWSGWCGGAGGFLC
jgi:hypothetical protein